MTVIGVDIFPDKNLKHRISTRCKRDKIFAGPPLRRNALGEVGAAPVM